MVMMPASLAGELSGPVKGDVLIDYLATRFNVTYWKKSKICLTVWNYQVRTC
jgi:hypothetical protein